jgi:hypothetical protein
MSEPRANAELQSRLAVSPEEGTRQWCRRTVRPFERVVHSVWVVSRGEAKPRLMGWIELKAFRVRRAWLKLYASLREAMTEYECIKGVEEGIVVFLR